MEKITGYVVKRTGNVYGIRTEMMLGISTSMQTALDNLEDYIKGSPFASTYDFHKNVFLSDDCSRLMFTQVDNPAEYVLFEVKKKTITIED